MFCTPWRERAEPGRTPDSKLPASSLHGWRELPALHLFPNHEPSWRQRGSPFLELRTHPQGARPRGSLAAPLSLTSFGRKHWSGGGSGLCQAHQGL